MWKEIIDMLNKFTGDAEWVVFFGVVISLIWTNTYSSLRYPDNGSGRNDRSLRLKILSEHRFAALYRRLVRKIVEQIDNVIYSKRLKVHNTLPIQKGNTSFIERFFDGKNPWDEACYSFCLSLAFIYPVFVVIIPWSLGATGLFVGQQVLPENTSSIVRVLIVLLIISSVIFGWLFSKADTGNKKKIYGISWVCSAISSVFASYSVGFPLVLLVGIASNSILAAVHSGLLSTLLVISLCAIISLICFIFGNNHYAVVLLVGGLFFSGLNSFWNWFRYKQRKGDNPSIYWLIAWNLFWFSTSFMVLYFLDRFSISISSETTLDARTLLCMFVLFPIINAPIDWLSLGLTRGLLEKICSGYHKLDALIWGVLDLFLAAFFWLLMLLIILFLFSLLNTVISKETFDISEFLIEMGKNPWSLNVIWLQLLAATTLLPTFVHLAVASFSLTNTVSHLVAHKMVGQILKNWPESEEVTGDKLHVTTLLFTFNIILSLFLPIYILINIGKLEILATIYIKNTALLINRLI